MKWVACISQTGEELYEVSKALGRKPDKLLAVPFNKMTDRVVEYFKDIPVFVYDKRPAVSQYLNVFVAADVITLHGFLYIIPKEICKVFDGRIYNGHPGDIVEYPELKGLDPQARAYERGEIKKQDKNIDFSSNKTKTNRVVSKEVQERNDLIRNKYKRR